jgi:glycosyltransferase involved in cell wall biosynthesis
MACGTPVVSTRCGGPEQYIINDETGYLVPKDDTVTMAKQIIELLADSDYQQRLSRNARNLITEEYNAARIRNQFQTILKRLRETTSG